MESRFCPHCGATNPPTATFCQYCGTVLPPAPAAPLPSTPAGAPPYAATPWGTPAYGTPPYAPPPPPPPRRRIVVWIIVGFVVLFLVVSAFAYFATPPSPSYNVIVTGINFASADNACGLDGASSYGFNASTNQSVPLTFTITGPNNTAGPGTAACMISSVTTSTTGFSISGANVPLNVPANGSPLLGFNVLTPADPYTGILTLVLT